MWIPRLCGAGADVVDALSRELEVLKGGARGSVALMPPSAGRPAASQSDCARLCSDGARAAGVFDGLSQDLEVLKVGSEALWSHFLNGLLRDDWTALEIALTVAAVCH